MTQQTTPLHISNAQNALEEYAKGNVHLVPTYPGILIRVIPKKAFDGALFLPEQYRNQPIREAIVLEVYKPKELALHNHKTSKNVIEKMQAILTHIKEETGYAADMQSSFDKLDEMIAAGFSHSSSIHVESSFKPGDHIAFPYFSGAPIPGLSDEDYRVIPDRNIFNTQRNDSGEPMLLIEYPDTTTRLRLDKMIVNTFDPSDETTDQILDEMLHTFHIIPKDQQCKIDYTNPTRPD